MKYFPLIWAGLWRKPMRTIFTFLSIVVAFLLFGILAGFQLNIAHLIEGSRLDGLVVSPRFGAPLPASYQSQIERVDGVAAAAKTDLIFGYYQEPKNTVFALATTPDFFVVDPDLDLSKTDRDALAKTRTGALISPMLAEKYGWKIGDKIPIHTPVQQKSGSTIWTFDVVGFVDSSISPRTQPIIIANYDYIDEARAANSGTTTMYRVRISNPTHVAEVSAAIDALFASSAAPTRTESNRANLENQLQSLGDFHFLTTAIGGAVLFMLLFLTGNSAMQSLRERIPEFGTMKALGYSDGGVLAIVVTESLVVFIAGAAVGFRLVGLFNTLTRNAPSGASVLLHLTLPWNAVALGLGLSVFASLASSVIPAWRVNRLSVVDALAGR